MERSSMSRYNYSPLHEWMVSEAESEGPTLAAILSLCVLEAFVSERLIP